MVITTSGTIATFKTPSSKPIQSLKVYFGPIQEGSGDPSPTNVRPISGRTGLEVIACGRNLLNLSDYAEQTSTVKGITFDTLADGSIIVNGLSTDGNSGAIKNYVINKSNLPPGRYYCSTGPFIRSVNDHAYMYPYTWDNATSSRIKQWDGITTMNFQSSGKYCEMLLPDEMKYEGKLRLIALRCYPGKTAVDEHFYLSIINSIENPDNISWEPYNARNLTVNWTSEVGTVYSGYMDLITGELAVCGRKIVLDENTNFTDYITEQGRVWVKIEDENVFITDSQFVADVCCTCDRLPKAITGPNSGKSLSVTVHQNGYAYINSPTLIDGVTDYISLKAWLAENPITIIAKFANPITYQLTPQQLSTLVGRNNIWGIDCDTTEVSYDFEDLLDMAKIRQKVLRACQVYRTKLPPGYKEYDWVQTSGSNARIDTGVSGDDETLKLQGGFTPIDLVNSYTAIFGNYQTENDHYCWRIICITNTNATYKNVLYYTAGNGSPGGGGTGVIYPTASTIEMLNRRVDFTMTYGKVVYTSQTRTSNATTTISNMSKTANTKNIALGSSTPTSTGGTTKFHIYRFKIWSHDKLIRDYHPCIRTKDNKAGFYDMINHTFNPSIGSVDFIAGNDIGGLYVYLDNSVYSAGDFVTADQNITSNNDFFITGFYDTGSTDAKSYTVTTNPLYPYGNDQSQHSIMLFYNDKTGTAVDYKYIGQTYATRTFTVTGRYIIASVYKPNAANFYIYDNTNQRYIIKGSNVT